MKLMLDNDAPVSAFAATGVAAATPCAALSAATAAVSPLAATAHPATHAEKARPITAPVSTAFKGISLSTATGNNPVLEIQVRPQALRYGGLRGVPPRGKPV